MDKVKETTKQNRDDRIGFKGMMLWQSRAISSGIFILLSGYLMVYCTDTMKVPAALVGGILVASKVLDGFTDIFAGFIVDRTKTRWGKGRPYEVFIIGLWLSTWLLFSCPESFSTVAKCIWIFVMYALANAVCYTFLNANQNVYLVRAYNQGQIVKQTSYGSVVTMLAAVIFNVAFPVAMGTLATSPAGWSRLILMFAVPLTAIGILRMLFVKEKYDVDAEREKEEKLHVKDVAVLLGTNKYILIIALMTFVFNFVTNMGVQVYYFTYIVGDVKLQGLVSLSQVIAIPLAFAFPKLIAKFSTIKLMTVGFLVSAIGYLLNFVAGSNMVLLMIGAILFGAGGIPGNMLLPLVIIECADFNEWKGIHRMEGTMTSINGLAQKIGGAIGAGALGVLLSLAGHTGDAATMPSSALMMIRMLYGIVPMALYLLEALTLKGYKLNKLMPQIKADNEAKRGQAAKGA